MAKVLEPISDEQLKKITVANLRIAYEKLATFYRSIINGQIVYCPHCGGWKSSKNFYSSKQSKDGLNHIACKSCLLEMATDQGQNGERIDNRKKTIEVFKLLDLPFIQKDYETQLNKINSEIAEKQRGTAFQQLLVLTMSLPQYEGRTFDSSEFGEQDEYGVCTGTENREPRKEIIKIFGSGFSKDDYLYLQDQYDDWQSRVSIDGKSQETVVTQICFKQLEIWKAQKCGRDTDKLITSLNNLMNAGNLQPRQNVGNASTDTLTFGQMIEKWENDDPIPEPDPEFADVDNIGKLLRVFFSGHLCRVLGLDNGYAKEYDEYIEKYTVEKPEYIGADDGTTSTYTKLFGKEVE